MDEKAQTALEYLLLIGGAVLIAAIVMTFLFTFSNQAKNNVETGRHSLANSAGEIKHLIK